MAQGKINKSPNPRTPAGDSSTTPDRDPQPQTSIVQQSQEWLAGESLDNPISISDDDSEPQGQSDDDSTDVVPDSDSENLGGRPTSLSPLRRASNNRGPWKLKSFPGDKANLREHKLDKANDALQLLMKCWQQIDTHILKPSDRLDLQYGIRDEFANSLCSLQKHLTDIQAELLKSQKQARNRWKQAKIAENYISFSENHRQGRGYRSNDSDTDEKNMKEARMERQLSDKKFSAEVRDRMREYSKSVLNTANVWKDVEAKLKQQLFLEDITNTVLLHFRLITIHLWSTANQYGRVEDSGPTDSEESRNIIGDLQSPYGYLYTQETREKFWRYMNRYMSARYYARTASRESQRRASRMRSNDQNRKRMRDDDSNGDDVCEAFGDRQCLERTRRRISYSS